MNGWLDYRWPKSSVAFIAGIFMFAGAVLFFLGDTWYTKYVCPFFFPIGVGLWLKHSWARWTAFVLIALTSALAVVVLVIGDFSASRAVRLLSAIWMLYALWEWDVYAERPQPDIAAVEE
ncbi:hypothetical protein LOC68_21840 [Blastopirellula sp. JC732]|uniref:Uncharacterized protein n=1 Tax=Blastopirellula sediminis TaxID=2894196 RepID=A0A9X1MS49_9BACT|nr:hypothetical protein [Blastopirellula sediminis]MCC9605658.1 hypothetical protein [Blastopirellula sediminis]MCC9631042.1 hypothetical protein [Blastopirellula sediminis]